MCTTNAGLCLTYTRALVTKKTKFWKPLIATRSIIILCCKTYFDIHTTFSHENHPKVKPRKICISTYIFQVCYGHVYTAKLVLVSHHIICTSWNKLDAVLQRSLAGRPTIGHMISFFDNFQWSYFLHLNSLVPDNSGKTNLQFNMAHL